MAGKKSEVRTFYSLLLEIKILIEVINSNFNHQFIGLPELFKKKAGFITGLTNYDEKESVYQRKCVPKKGKQKDLWR